MYFSIATHKTIKAEQSNLAPKERIKLIGEKWRALPPEEKQHFEALAAEDRKRYEREKEIYETGKSSRKPDEEQTGKSSSKLDAEQSGPGMEIEKQDERTSKTEENAKEDQGASKDDLKQT